MVLYNFAFVGRAPRRRSRAAPNAEATAGYALIDGLVALMIFATTLALGFEALARAGQAAAMSSEVRRADTLLAHLLENGPRRLAGAAGQSDGFAWRLDMALMGADRPIAVCRRAVTLTNLRSGRSYAAATLETCPPETPA